MENHPIYKEETSGAKCPRCGAALRLRYSIDYRATRERPAFRGALPGTQTPPDPIYERDAYVALCPECPYQLQLRKQRKSLTTRRIGARRKD